jgi:hypothetical protein
MSCGFEFEFGIILREKHANRPTDGTQLKRAVAFCNLTFAD